jgi:hypothetical protein
MLTNDSTVMADMRLECGSSLKLPDLAVLVNAIGELSTLHQSLS